MKDIAGKEIQVGDRVATNLVGYAYQLQIAQVTGFTAKKVQILESNGDYSNRYPKQVAVLVQEKQ